MIDIVSTLPASMLLLFVMVKPIRECVSIVFIDVVVILVIVVSTVLLVIVISSILLPTISKIVVIVFSY